MDSIEEEVRRLIANHLVCEYEDVAPAASLRDDLDADDLDMIEIAMDIEDLFDVEISDETAEGFTTVADVINYVSKIAVA